MQKENSIDYLKKEQFLDYPNKPVAINKLLNEL